MPGLGHHNLEERREFQELNEVEKALVLRRMDLMGNEELEEKRADVKELVVKLLDNEAMEWDFDLDKLELKAFDFDRLAKIPRRFHGGVAMKLIEAGKGWGWCVGEYLEKFEELDHKEVAMKLIEAGLGWYVAGKSEKFKGLDHKEVVMKLIEAGEGDVVARNLEKFEELDHKEVAMKLIEAGKGQNVVDNLGKFEGLDREVVMKLIEARVGHYVPGKLEKFKGLDYKEVAMKLIEDGAGLSVADHLGGFEGLDHKEVAMKLIEAGKGFGVARNLEKFKGLDHKEVAMKLIEAGDGWYVGEHLEKFEELDHKEVVMKFIEAGDGLNLVENLGKFEGVLDDRSIGEKIFKSLIMRSNWVIPIMVEVNLAYKPSIDKIFTQAYDIFGEYLDKKVYETVRDIQEGVISVEELRSLGVTKRGEVGLNQLRVRLNKFKVEIFDETFDASILKKSPVYAQYYKAHIRFEKSEWGNHDEKSFEKIIEKNIFLQNENKLALAEGYVPSGEIRVGKVNKEAQESFQYSEQFLSRYNVLRESLAEAMRLLEMKKPLSDLIARAEAKLKKILVELGIKLQQNNNPKAVENLNQRIGILKAIDLRNVKGFQENFSKLAQFSEFQEELRQLVFYYALHKHKNQREIVVELVKKSKPAFDEVSAMMNFIDHIVNQETWKEYFTDVHALKAFNSLVNIKSFEEEFNRAQNQALSGTALMEFIPTRGLLLEFSGHIGDACWASKYENLAQEFPNLTAMIMVQNRGTKYERLAGAALMFETEAEDGTKLLVIRGLNPIENVINSLSVEDFFEKFVGYAREIAKNTGRKLAIVIDKVSGGSATNRPALFTFLENKKSDLQKVPLKSAKGTTFNGYDITGCTYLIRD